MRLFVLGILLAIFGAALLSKAFNEMTVMIGAGSLTIGAGIIGLLLWYSMKPRRVENAR